MKIEFNDEKDLVNKIMESGVDVYRFGINFMDAFGIALCRTHQDRLEYAEKKRREKTSEIEEKMGGWGCEPLCEMDIPDWVKHNVQTRSGIPFHSAAKAILKPYENSPYVFRDFVSTREQYFFNPSGAVFLLYSMVRRSWLAEDEYYRWRDEAGITE